MSDVKFCKDCKFCKPDNWMLWGRLKYAKCLADPHETSEEFFPVTGKRRNRITFFFCTTSRKYSQCGPKGKLWEAKP